MYKNLLQLPAIPFKSRFSVTFAERFGDWVFVPPPLRCSILCPLFKQTFDCQD